MTVAKKQDVGISRAECVERTKSTPGDKTAYLGVVWKRRKFKSR